MAEQTPYRSEQPDNYDEFDEAPTRSYVFGRAARTEFGARESMPLFLSDPEGDPDPAEYANPLRRYRGGASISLRILMGVLAASGVAMLFAWFTSDGTRDLIASTRDSISTMLPVPSAAAQPDPTPPSATQLTAKDVQLKDPARWSPAANQSDAAARGHLLAMGPSRDEISTAYQSAVQNQAQPAAQQPAVQVSAPQAPAPQAASPQAPPVAVASLPPAPAPTAATAPAVRHIDAEELAVLLTRAKNLLAVGDIPAARLLLRRAADAREAVAALMLAQTYDPAVLGTPDVRNVNPDPAMARSWYEKAAQLGSTEAQRRLAQMQN